jgi:hypothetical protein
VRLRLSSTAMTAACEAIGALPPRPTALRSETGLVVDDWPARLTWPSFHRQRFGIRRSQNGEGSKGEKIFSSAVLAAGCLKIAAGKDVDACRASYPDRIGGEKTRRASRREVTREECRPLGYRERRPARGCGRLVKPLDARPAALVH